MSEDDNLVVEKIKEKSSGFLGKIRGALSSVLSWFKGNWSGVLILVAIVAIAAMAFKGCDQMEAYETLFQQYQQSIDAHQQQLDDIREVQNNERQERDRQLQEFIEEMNRIEREYKEQINQIEIDRQATQSDIVREARRDPETLTRRIRDTFGIPLD